MYVWSFLFVICIICFREIISAEFNKNTFEYKEYSFAALQQVMLILTQIALLVLQSNGKQLPFWCTWLLLTFMPPNRDYESATSKYHNITDDEPDLHLKLIPYAAQLCSDKRGHSTC